MSSLTEEYRIVENGVGLIELFHAVLCFKGADRKKFLQGVASNDIQKLKKTELLPTCFLNPKGRLIATAKLFEKGEEIWGMISAQGFELLKKSLQTQFLFSETELLDISEPYRWIFGIGKEATHFISSPSPWMGENQGEGDKLEILHNTGWYYPSFLLLTPRNKTEKIFSTLLENKKNYPIEKISKETFNLLRIESGIPLFGVEMDEKTIPNEVNLESYISYTKGCYTGQETISRIKHYGHVNKLLVKMQFRTEETIPQNISVWVEDKEVGKITSSVYSPKLKNQIALGMIKYEFSKKDTKVLIRLDEKEVKGIVL